MNSNASSQCIFPMHLPKIFSLVFFIFVGWSVSPSFGQSTLYWYPGSAPTQGGTGTWNATTSYWSTTSGVTKTPAGSIPQNGDSVVFGGTAGTVNYNSASGYPELNDWKVESNGYVFRMDANPRTISVNSFSGSGLSSATITSGGNNALTLDIGGDTAFTGTIENGIGTLSITKKGIGRLDLSDATLTYTKPTAIAEGSFWLKANQINSLTGVIGIGTGDSQTGIVTVIGGGSVTKSLGTSDGTIYLGSDLTKHQGAGFGTTGANLILDFGGGGAGTTLGWGSAGLRAETFTLGTTNSTHTVILKNNLKLDSDNRILRVENGSANIDAEISGALSTLTPGRILKKDGEGTLLLSGTTNSVLRLNHSEGIIFVGSGGSWKSTANNTDYGIQVGASAILGGNGSVELTAAPLQVNGALLAGMGVGTETLTFNGNLEMKTDSVLMFSLGDEVNDKIARTGGTWSFQSSQKVTFFDVGAISGGYTYTLISGLASTVDVSNWQLVNSGSWDGTFTSDANNVYFTASVIPEPSTSILLLMAALGMSGIIYVRRRQAK